jgi:amino acid adenylation domain-containing protein
MRIDSVQDEISRLAAASGSAIALSAPGEQVTYAELEERSNRLANYLLERGAAKGDRVAVLAEDSIQVITALLAILKAGCVFVPLDPAAPPARLAAQVAPARPGWFLLEASFAPRVGSLAAMVSAKCLVVDAGPWNPADLSGLEVLAGYPEYRHAGRPPSVLGPDDLCYLYFTSGSTGKPKGIGGRFKSIGHFVGWEIETFHLGPGVRVSQLTTPSFDAFLRDVLTPLCAGGTVCIPAGRDTVLDARQLAAWIDEAGVEIVHCVPSLFRTLINQPLTPDRFPALRAILMAGEPLLPADVKKWMDVFGGRIQLVNLYGPSETTMVKFFYLVQPGDQNLRSIPIGKPMAGARAVLVDSRGKACQPGTVGEIYIRTPYRSLGYYEQPELTREVFVPNPFSQDPEDIVYKTGDFGRTLEDGNFEFLGRRDHQVKVRGVRVELPEIENTLREHGGVSDMVVIDRQDAEGNKYLCAYLVAGPEVDLGELRQICADRLLEVMVPSSFVRLEELPRTLSGKIDRAALPEPNLSRSQRGHVAPRTVVEEVVAGIWARVLGIDEVGIEESFFALGGHSLLATRVLSRIGEAFRLDLPLRSLFEAPTVAAFAERVEAALQAEHGIEAPRIERLPRREALPLSFAQQRLWFMYQLEPESAAYNLPAAARFTGPLEPSALARALSEIVRRHEVLRTVFSGAGESAVQIVTEALSFDLPLVDLAGLPPAARERATSALADRHAATVFELRRGPLLRAQLVRLAPEEHLVLFAMHHIASDAWSFSILLREIGVLYEAFSGGEASLLPELTIQYADFSAWQRNWLRGAVLESQISYWKQKLAALPTVQLPLARPRRGGPGRLESATRVVPQELIVAAKDLCHREGATLFMALMAAFLILLRRISGQEDLVIGADVAGRNRLETEGLIGLFVNQLVLRTDLSGNPGFREVLARVRETLLGAYVHQDLPFEKLVEVLNPERGGGSTPLFQIKIILQNVPDQALTLPGIAIRPVGVARLEAKFDLILEMLEVPAGLVARLDYDSDLFDARTITPLLEQLESVLRNVVSDPGVRVESLVAAIDEHEREKRKESLAGFEQARLNKLQETRLKLAARAKES